jgi:hypothetical protein
LSRAVTGIAFEPGTRNRELFGLANHDRGVAALDRVEKGHGSILPVNHNHWSYPASAHFYAEDARELALSYPATYAEKLAHDSLPRFFSALDQDGFVARNRTAVTRLADAFDALETSPFARALLALGVTGALGAALSRYTPRGERMVLALGLLCCAWVTAVGIVGEYGENHRFRYSMFWLGWALALAGNVRLLRSLAQLPVLPRLPSLWSTS